MSLSRQFFHPTRICEETQSRKFLLLKLSEKDTSDLEGEFFALGTLTLEYIPPVKLEEMTIKVDKGGKKTYGIDVL